MSKNDGNRAVQSDDIAGKIAQYDIDQDFPNYVNE